MTEVEWLACTDPRPMLEFIRGKASGRKFRLFAVACCRHVWDRLLTDWSRDAVEVTEQFADGRTELYERERINRERWLSESYELGRIPPGGRPADRITELLTGREGWRRAWKRAREVAWETSSLGARRKERQFQATVLRCMFGNPFRPVTVTPAWLAWNDACVVKIAQTIYDERRFQDLPILADALEDADCDNANILKHCRDTGEHTRGCWVVDLLLGNG